MSLIDDLLAHLTESEASDLHVKPGSPPRVRVDGQLRATPFAAPDPDEVASVIDELLDPEHRSELDRAGEVETGLSIPGLGRFRIHAHRQRGSLSFVVRRIPPGIRPLDQLGLPAQVERFAEEERGLLLVSGGSSSGRSTTVAALVDRINSTRECHVLTVEDPIEVLHSDKRAIVTQREVGSDTPSYAHALAGAARADADVVVVGDVPDAATAQAALAVAEGGRLVICVLRAGGAADALFRFVELFPVERQAQARQVLSSVMRGVVHQRLVDRADDRGRVVAAEVLVGTAKVLDCLEDPSRHGELDRLMAEGQYHGMQTLDDALLELVRDGLVAGHDALAVANRPDELRFALDQAGL